VIFARANDSDCSTVHASARVREEDGKYLRKRDKNPGARTTGPQVRDEEVTFDTLGITWFVRWENDYRIIDPGAQDRSVEVKMAFDPGASVKRKIMHPDGKPLKGVTLAGHGVYGERTPTFTTAEFEVGGLDPKGQPQQLYLLHKGRKLSRDLR
jgi:hypothetical protein